jgi:hypothetical protein
VNATHPIGEQAVCRWVKQLKSAFDASFHVEIVITNLVSCATTQAGFFRSFDRIFPLHKQKRQPVAGLPLAGGA